LADKAGNGCDWIGASVTKLLATVDELDLLLFDYQHNAVGVLCDGFDLLIFQKIVAIASMKVSKFFLTALVSFVAQRCSCKLLLGICQLTFCMLLSMN
jgi:hypothetical protein